MNNFGGVRLRGFWRQHIAGKYLRTLGIAVLLAVVIIQLIFGIHPAKNYASDFQWAGARMLAHHLDPWAAALHGDHVDHLSPPNYLHELYFLIMPLAWLSFPVAAAAWQVVNVCLSCAIVFSLSRAFHLSRAAGALLLLLLWASNSFRITLALGQVSLLELYLFCIFFESISNLEKSIPLGLSYAKYSFSPVLVLFLAFQRKFKLLALSLLFPAVGFLLAWWMLGGSLIHLALEPLLVSRSHVCSGFGDTMELADRLFNRGNAEDGACQETVSPWSYLLSLGLSVGYAFWLARRSFARRAIMALLALASLVLFRHLVYDYVFLVVPLAYVLSERSKAARLARAAVFTTVFLFWYVYRFVGLVKSPRLPFPLVLLNVVLIMTCIWSVGKYAKQEQSRSYLGKPGEHSP